MDKTRGELIQEKCTHFLAYHYRQSPHQMLLDLAEATPASWKSDYYGAGELIEAFEKEVAALLGKEAAVFMPSGTMAQQIALRLWSERRQSPHVAFHPKCHLEIHEQKGYQILHGLHGVLVGDPDALVTLDDLKVVRDPLAALLLELPQREIGGHLPSWEALQEIFAWAHEHQVPLHMDGARLWECQPFYGRKYAEIAGLFDTVYVSFYKGLGGLAGAILAGPEPFIADAHLWQRRHGGNLIRLFPYVVSARQGLQQRLARMQAYHDKAVEVASVLNEFPEIETSPNPPHTNMMHIFLRGDRERLLNAALDVSEATGVWLTGHLNPTPMPDYHKFELTVGDATLDLSADRIRELFGMVLAKASAVGD